MPLFSASPPGLANVIYMCVFARLGEGVLANVTARGCGPARVRMVGEIKSGACDRGGRVAPTPVYSGANIWATRNNLA